MGRPCRFDDVGPGTWGQDLGFFSYSGGDVISVIQRTCMRVSDSTVKIEPEPRPVCRMFDLCEGCPYQDVQTALNMHIL